MNINKYILNKKGDCLIFVLFTAMIMILVLFFLMLFSNKSPGDIVSISNTTCTIDRVYTEDNDDSTDYYVKVSTDNLTANFKNQKLYNKYKGHENEKIPAEVTTYKTSDGNIVKIITNIL